MGLPSRIQLMQLGKVILLQGISSAGKSTLAAAMQLALEEHWWMFEADDITRMQATSERSGWWQLTPEEKPHSSWNSDQRLKQWLAGYFGCIATIAKSGSNVIAVGGWLQTEWLLELAASLEEIEAYCVGVYCSAEEAERREMARGDRHVGYSRNQLDLVHTHAPYDAHVDTEFQTAEECVHVIEQMLFHPPNQPFFERIRKMKGE